MLPDHIADTNVERLLESSYQPALADPAFVKEVTALMLTTAQSLAGRAPAPPEPDAERLHKIRWRMGWAFACAASLAIMMLIFRAMDRPADKPDSVVAKKAERDNITPASAQVSVGLTPRPRTVAPEQTKIAVGTDITTLPDQRRRVTLADGSVLYLNAGTTVKYQAERQVKLLRGELFVEVAPRPAGSSGASFVVHTPDRSVKALGTRFSVWADGAQSGLAVTQGKVQVTGLEALIHAGQQLAAGAKVPEVAPRASYTLKWMRELMLAAESPLVPASERAGGALVAVDPNGQEMRLTLRKFHLDVYIEDGFARTTIDQTYFNETYSRLEGTFYFPLPPDATLSRLAMYVKENNQCKLMEGGMAERDHARNVFETIMHMRRDPALLEWVDGSTFKMRVFPLEAREEKRIILSYTQKLATLYGTANYRFPAGHSMTTVGEWSFEARVKDGFAAGLNCSSTSHPAMQVKADGADRVLSIKEKNATLSKDVALTIADGSKDGAAQGISRLSTFMHEGAHYLMLRYRPKLAGGTTRERRDWVFLYEASANRDPLLARAQIDVMRGLLENAEHDDTFMVVAANTRVHQMSAKPQAATADNVKDAVQFLEGVQLIGALDLASALTTVEPILKSAKNPYLVHIGSGVATMGARNDATLAKLIPATTKYIGVGVGKQWSRAFMKLAAERTGGYFTQINPDEVLNWRAFDLLATLNTPRMLDMSVSGKTAAGDVRWLADTTMLAQGEEICAVARVAKDDPFPKSVVVKGMFDGKEVVKDIAFENARDGAGYLPRQWAKLELDRLLAEDAEANKAAIIALSKQSYVMTPYTSLLVLETEADYEKYKVDRGRKDHWAMYECPDRIPVVYEPVKTGLAQAAKDKCDPDQVLSTIMVRVPPQLVTTAHLPQLGYWPQAVIANEYYRAADMNAIDLDTVVKANTRWGLERGLRKARGLEPSLWILEEAALLKKARSAANPLSLPELGVTILRNGNIKNMEEVLKLLYAEERSAGLSKKRVLDRLGGFGPTFGHFSDQDWGEIVGGKSDTSFGVGGANTIFNDTRLLHFYAHLNFDANETGFLGERYYFAGAFPTPNAGGGGFASGSQGLAARGLFFPTPRAAGGGFTAGGDVRNRSFDWQSIQGRYGLAIDLPGIAQAVAEGNKGGFGRDTGFAGRGHTLRFLPRLLQHTSDAQGLLYDRPTFTGTKRIFDDLLWYAPAMNSSPADIAATLDAEVTPDPDAKLGSVDHAARLLIDKARATGWQRLTVDANGRHPSFVVYFDGQGRFTYERLLDSGLREQVICDGKRLWHLYPEIGLGAKRTVSRFHRQEFQAMVPWLVPSTDDLVHGCDVRLVDNTTVGIVPRGADSLREDQGKPRSFLQVNLVFDPTGRLTERHVILMPENKIISRVCFGVDHHVTIHDPDGKSATEKLIFQVALAEAPSLEPTVKDFVVLPMPLRAPAFHQASIIQGDMAKYDEELAISRLSTACASHNLAHATEIYDKRFAEKGDRRIGFAVLLASAGGLAALPGDSQRSALADYLASRFDTIDLSKLGGPEGGFIQRLSRFRLLWEKGEVDKQATLKALGTSPLLVFDWALLVRMCRNGVKADAATATALINACNAFKDNPGLHYAARYEVAQAIFASGDKARARQLYRELYTDTVGVREMPLIDKGFRDALMAPDDKGPNYIDLMRQAAAILAKHDQRSELFALAWQNVQLGDPEIGTEVAAKALAVCEPTPDRDLSRLIAVHFYQHTKQPMLADLTLQLLLAEEPFKSSPALWRLAAELAGQRNQSGRAAICLEKVLDLEFRDLPQEVNLQTIRDDYSRLLLQYQQVANALAVLEKEPPRDFVAKVIRAADRWRSLDADPTQACQLAAKILQTVGLNDLAWDYLTTPIALKPNEAKPWWDLAKALAADGSMILADRAFVQAFEMEPTNAQILWERATALDQAGRRTVARDVYLMLANGQWQDRFQWIKVEANLRLQR